MIHASGREAPGDTGSAVRPTGEPPPEDGFGLEHVTHAYGSTRVLHDVTYRLRPGQVSGLVGQNGAGKSTMVKILSGSITPVSGQIVIAGRPLSITSPADAQRLGAITIHQDPQLFPDMNVAKAIHGLHAPLPRRRRTGLVAWGVAHRRAEELLSSLDIHVSPRRLVGSLSLAEQRLVEIAAAMARGPRFLILDEVTASLEHGAAEKVLDLVRKLATRGAGICFVSHRLYEVRRVCDEVVVLRDGEIVDRLARETATEAAMVASMLGRDQAPVAQRSGPGPAVTREPLLRITELVLPSTGTTVDFEVRRGEVLGVTGALGSGAPDAVRVIGGAQRSRCVGTVDGKAIRTGSPRRSARHGIYFLSGNRRAEGVVPQMSIAANIGLSALSSLSTGGFVARRTLYRLAEDFRERLGIRMGGPGAAVTTLSGGNQQKVLIARGLASSPRLFCIDEPTQGVDFGSRTHIHALLRDFADNGGSVLMFSSEPEDLVAACDRVAVFRHGEIAAVLEGEQLTHANVLLASSSGRTAVGAEHGVLALVRRHEA